MGNSTSSSSSEDDQDQHLNILQCLSNFETTSPQTMAKAFCEAVDSDRKTLFKALHEHVQLNWFGRTVRRSKNVIKFLDLIAPFTSHQDISASEMIPDVFSFSDSWDSFDTDEECDEGLSENLQVSSNINGAQQVSNNEQPPKNSQASASNIDGTQRDSSKLSKTDKKSDPKLPETSPKPFKTEKGQQKIYQYLTSVKNIKANLLIELECKPLREDHMEVEPEISKNPQNLGKIKGVGGGIDVGSSPVTKKDDNLGKNEGVDQGIDVGSSLVTKKDNLGKRHAEDTTFFESLRDERQDNKRRENMEKSLDIEPELNNNNYDNILPKIENINPLSDNNIDDVVPKVCLSKLKISNESESQKNCGDNSGETALNSFGQINKSNSTLENAMQVDETPEELSEVSKEVEKKERGGIGKASVRQVLINGTLFMGKAEKKGRKKRVWEKFMKSLTIVFDKQDIKFIEYTGASCARNLMKLYEKDSETVNEP